MCVCGLKRAPLNSCCCLGDILCRPRFEFSRMNAVTSGSCPRRTITFEWALRKPVACLMEFERKSEFEKTLYGLNAGKKLLKLEANNTIAVHFILYMKDVE